MVEATIVSNLQNLSCTPGIIATLSLFVATTHWTIRRIFPPIPVQMVDYWIGDEGVFGGEATLFVKRQSVSEFRITFEGENTGGSGKAGHWVVEGCEAGPMPWSLRYFESTQIGRAHV